MNCTTAQGISCAMQRRIMPNPLEDLPLPAPVWTISSPLSPALPAMILSRAAFFLAILRAWRAFSSPKASLGGRASAGRVSSVGINHLRCLTRRPVLPQVRQRWFLFYDRRRGNAKGGNPQSCRPRDRDRRGRPCHWPQGSGRRVTVGATLDPQAGRPASAKGLNGRTGCSATSRHAPFAVRALAIPDHF